VEDQLRNRKSVVAAVTAIAALLALSFLVGCPKKGGGDDTYARVNGRKIPKAEVEKYFKQQTESAPQPPSEEQGLSLKLSILRELIDNEILMQRAEKLGLVATDEEVESKLNEIKAPFTKEEFEKRMKDRNSTPDDLKRDIRKSLTIDKVLNKEITSKINISDGDISSYYNAHKAEFNLIEPQYHMSQILVTSQPNPQVRNLKNDKAQNEADAKKKVQQLVNRLDSGEDFATVAMNYSEQPETSANGGDLGFVPESSLKSDKQAFEAIQKLKPGQYTAALPASDGPTNRVFGYRIIRLISKEPAGQRDLNDPRVQQAIREQLRDRREQLLKAAYYETLHNNASIDNFLADSVLKNEGTGK
jgi:peptidyl-prolyl cis-trans isomerase SurA